MGASRGRSCWATLLALALVSSSAAASDSAIDRLQELGQALRGAPVWGADYRQEYVPAGMTIGEVEAGQVQAAWPDHALFVTGDPPVRVMGLEGRLVRLVDLEVETCDEHVLDDEEWARVPLAAVLDPQAAVDHFSILELGARGVALIPREAGGVSRVEVEVGDDGLPSEVRITDPQGSVNRLSFSGWTAIPEKERSPWLPEPPPGVPCVTDAPGGAG